MALRNFWIDAHIDGRRTDLCGGPRNKEGGLNIALYQRQDGEKVEAVRIRSYERNGKLFTDIEINGVFAGRFETRR